MLPSVLAKQLQQGLADYIETTFPMTNPTFRGSLGRMLKTPDSVFHEPYTAVRLPFRTAENAPDLFEAVHPSFAPYVHQQKAYERLCGNDGRSTLIATGTGSGKTECFLYPILEYCYQHRGERGIKALIIYPMNALASDQAKRIAGLIYNSPELRGNVTAGMFVGGFEHTPSRMMSETQVITDKETMRGAPPDILMTNYKMLDYLLVRPEDATLWEENGPEVLKYIAVDELHTFDGAQGTDLACLLRRLKARLFTPTGFLCCVGTSATMGAKDSSSGMREYAQKVFGETFEEDSVITEDRLSADEFFAGHDATDYCVPDSDNIAALLGCIENDDEQSYLRTAAAGWLSNPPDKIDSIEARLALGQILMNHSFTQSLLTLMADKYMQTSAICEALGTKYPALSSLPDATTAIDALFALISHARTGDNVHPRPFLNVQTQLWFRELRRLEAKVSADDITYALSTDLNDQQAKHYLPVVNCRDCGATGWVSMANERGNVTMGDLSTFYNLYFKADKKIRMLFPCDHD
ncbi:MAG: DEAD/DEAH box helicase, partial [Clostridia bacterium]|nr:DEAD/DEAH box helicase [Clostridia bacterium]